MQDFSSYANQAAWIAVAQMPLIIALAGKNNLVSCRSCPTFRGDLVLISTLVLTGISYEKLNFLHRAAGRVCFLCVWIHSGGHFYNFGGFHSENWATQLSRWVNRVSSLSLSLVHYLRSCSSLGFGIGIRMIAC